MYQVHCAYGVIPVMADAIEKTYHQYLLKFRGELVAAFPLNMVTDIVQNDVSVLVDGK